jgi:hypothetical protein
VGAFLGGLLNLFQKGQTPGLGVGKCSLDAIALQLADLVTGKMMTIRRIIVLYIGNWRPAWNEQGRNYPARLNQISKVFQDGQMLEGVRFVNPFGPQFKLDRWA